MGSDEILSYVANMKKMALAEAYTRAAADSYDAVVEATAELTKAQETQGEISDTLAEKKELLEEIEERQAERSGELEELQRRYDEALASGSEETGKYVEQMAALENQTYQVNGQTVAYGEAVRILGDEITRLEQQERSAAEAVNEHAI